MQQGLGQSRKDLEKIVFHSSALGVVDKLIRLLYYVKGFARDMQDIPKDPCPYTDKSRIAYPPCLGKCWAA